jgi:hypothetical protein
MTLFAWLAEVVNLFGMSRLAKLAFLARQPALAYIAVLILIVRLWWRAGRTFWPVWLAICMFLYYLLVCLSVCLFVLVSPCISVSLTTYLLVYILSMCLYLVLSANLPIRLSVWLADWLAGMAERSGCLGSRDCLAVPLASWMVGYLSSWLTCVTTGIVAWVSDSMFALSFAGRADLGSKSCPTQIVSKVFMDVHLKLSP